MSKPKIHAHILELPAGSGYFRLVLTRNGARQGWEIEDSLEPCFSSCTDAKGHASRIIREIREGKIVRDEEEDR